MAELKQSTARVRVFKMIDSADHFSKKTGLTCTVNLSKNGAAFGAAAGAVAEIANGWYSVSLTAADTGTLGDLAYYITASGADDTDFCDQITAQILGDTLTANTTQLAGQTVTAAAGVTFPSSVASPTNITAGTITTVTTVTNQLTAAQIATGVWQDTTAGDFTTASSIGKSLYTSGAVPGTANGLFIAGANAATTVNVTGNLSGSVGSVTAGVTVTTNNDKTGYGLSAAAVQAVWDALTAALTTVGSIGKKLADWTIGTAQTGDAFARLGAPAGASVSADVAAIKSDSAAIKTKTDSLTYTVAGQVDANIQYVNDVLVTGNGSGGTPWGP